MTSLSQNGMGQQVQSWIGSGQNQPISGSDVQRALDPGQLQQMAQRQGTSSDEYSNHIAQAPARNPGARRAARPLRLLE